MRPGVVSALTLIALVAGSGAASAAGTEDVTADEQQFVYELNLVRRDPAAYAARVGLADDLADVLPRPPLAISGPLSDSSSFHSEEMAAYGYIAHQSAETGEWPNKMARDHGYPLAELFVDDANYIESIHVGSPILANVLQSLINSPSHRAHLLGERSFFGNHREIGVGRSSEGNYWTVHTAYEDTSDVFLTGVVFDDLNGNGRMDGGEGLGGVTVAAGELHTATNSGGGWSMRVGDDATYAVTASGGGFSGTGSAMVQVDGFNVQVDFISGQGEGVVFAYRLCNGVEPTIVGTAGDDVIHGLGGDDVIDGGGGNDLICRGGPLPDDPCPVGGTCDPAVTTQGVPDYGLYVGLFIALVLAAVT
ncbi:MAG: CAP domain-containing protein [Acidimicrobiia bacterium]